MVDNPKPDLRLGSRLALQLDARGLSVYGNRAGLISLAERLLCIAEAEPKDCYECHTRMELGDAFGFGDPGEVSLVIDEELDKYFSGLPDDAPPGSMPFGFELTFMHIDEAGLDDVKRVGSGKTSSG